MIFFSLGDKLSCIPCTKNVNYVILLNILCKNTLLFDLQQKKQNLLPILKAPGISKEASLS